jgi:hypothetical protein
VELVDGVFPGAHFRLQLPLQGRTGLEKRSA